MKAADEVRLNQMGRIEVSYVVFECEGFAEALAMIRFRPARVEHNFCTRTFDMQGFSPFFEEVLIGQEMSRYTLEVTRDESGSLVEVKAVKL